MKIDKICLYKVFCNKIYAINIRFDQDLVKNLHSFYPKQFGK